MKALITGALGFIGRHMRWELRERGYETFGWDVGEHPAKLYLGPDRWDEEFDLVVHCAYHVGGRKAIDGEPRNLARNLALDAQLFDWAAERRDSIGRVLYFSSSAAYPTYLQHSIMADYRLKEDDIDAPAISLMHAEGDDVAALYGKPDARYGWAKLTGERLVAAYRELGGRVTVVRPFSGYGEDQAIEYPFPAFVRKAKHLVTGFNKEFEIWGDPNSTRDWIHVDDVVKGALAVAECQGKSHAGPCTIPPERETEPVNLCTGQATTFFHLAFEMLKTAGWKGTTAPFAVNPQAPQGVMHRVGDPTRFETYYRPTITLEQGIERAMRDAVR